METYIYRIEIDFSHWEQMKLKRPTYAKEQEAIDILTTGFDKLGKTYSIRDEENRKVFINEDGGELAVIIPVKCC